VARKLIVELVGDASSLNKTYRQAANNTKKFETEMGRMTRGVVVGSGALHGLGRNLAIAGAGFLGFASATEAIKTSVSAALDAGKAQRSLAAQMKAAGESFAANRKQVEAASLSLEKYGFTTEDSEKALTVLERGTGRISRAMQLQGVAANLARARNMDLSAAAAVLAKVFGNQETALRRAVPGLDKERHGMELIYQAAQKLSGQARANTTEFDRFHATLHNTEVIIGTALLPTIDRLLTRFTSWLDKLNRSGRLQRDVESAVKTLTGAFNALMDIVRPLARVFKALGDAVGGTRNEVKLLAAAFLAFKGARLVEGLAGIGTAAKNSKTEVSLLRAALTRLGTMGAIGVTIAISYVVSKEGQRFAKWLGGQGIPGVGTKNIPAGGLPVAARAAVAQGMSQDEFVKRVALGGVSSGDATKAYNAAVRAMTYTVTRPAGRGVIGGAAGPGRVSVPGGVSGIGNQPLTAAQQLAVGLAAHPDDIALLRQQAGRDRAAIAFAGKLRAQNRISNAKYVQEVTNYQNDLTQTLDHINQINQAAADKARAAADKEKAAREKALREAQREAQAADRIRISHAKALLVTAKSTKGFADDQVAYNKLIEAYIKESQDKRVSATGRAAARTSAATVRATLRGEEDKRAKAERDAQAAAVALQLKRERTVVEDVNKRFQRYSRVQQQFQVPIQLQLEQARLEATGAATPELQALYRREKEAAEKALKSGKLSINAQIEAWNFITQANNELAQNLSDFGPTGKVASSAAATSGIAFKNLAARREEEARIAQIISHGGRVPSAMSLQGQTIQVHSDIHIDGTKVATAVTNHQTKGARHRAVQNSGIHAGKPLP
jgi:hypothetical protein